MDRYEAEKAGGDQTGRSREAVGAVMRKLEQEGAAHPFRPCPLIPGGHAQTLAAWAWPRRFRPAETRGDGTRLFEVEPGVRLLARCRWHEEDRARRVTVLLVHGLGGSADAPYMVGAARLAHRAGANVIRLNQRNCGGTEHLTPTLYHSGMSGDLAAIVRELEARDGLTRILVAGFSMGGNLALKMAGEMGEDTPSSLLGICAVSPALDLAATVTNLERPSNYAYERTFARGLRRLVVRKKHLYPNLYDTSALARARGVRDFDELYTAPHGGFDGASDYYRRASAIHRTSRIRLPTLVIHAQDDPLVPFEPLRRPEVLHNPNIHLAAPPHGGHVAFVSTSKTERFWAEGRLARFLELLSA